MKSARMSPVNVPNEPKSKLPLLKKSKLKSFRTREISPPNLNSCRPCVHVTLSAHRKVISLRLVGPPGEGPRLKSGVKIIGGAVPLGSSGFTLAKPSDAGEVVSCGTASCSASRFTLNRNSFTKVGLNVWTHEA